MKSGLRNWLKLGAIILLTIAALVLVTQFVKRRAALKQESEKAASEKVNKPKCAELKLKCYGDPDCGTKCFCDRQGGSALGNCVAK